MKSLASSTLRPPGVQGLVEQGAPAALVGPKDFTANSEKLDFREGGAYRHLIHGPDGKSYGMSGVYREIVEPERIVFTSLGTTRPQRP